MKRDPLAVEDRQPPYSAEAEQSLLACLLQDITVLPAVAEIVDEASFFALAHQLIYRAVVTLARERRATDPITVCGALEATGAPVEQWGGLQYLVSLQTSLPSVEHAREYAAIVAERASERALIAGMDEAARVSWDKSKPLAARVERIAGLLQEVERRRSGQGSRGVPFLDVAALEQAAENVRWLVKGAIPADSIGLLFGGSGSGKSFVSLDLALHTAHGLPWLGRKTAKGPVIFIAAEGGAGLWRRIQAWHKARRLDAKDAQIYVVPVALDLATDAWRVVDAAQLAGVTPALVVVDTLSQTFAGEENSANEVAAYLRELGARFRALWACCVLVVHHSGHQATERPRGSSALRANVDFMFGLFRDGDGMVATLLNDKQKDGETLPEQEFKLTKIDLGTDEDGDPITSLVASRMHDTGEVLEVMAEDKKHGRKGRNGLLLELAKDGQSVKDLRQAFADATDLTGDVARQAFHRAMTWAQKRGLIQSQDGQITILRRI